jgi:hypothetical protein
MGVLSGVVVTATVGGRVWVGGITFAVRVAGAINGVTVGKGIDVSVAAGSDVTAFGPKLNGSLISIKGANRFVI